MILTPEGRVTRYFYGIEYPARDVRLGLVEASHNRIGSAIDQVMLYCYHYDPAQREIRPGDQNVLRMAGLLTVGCCWRRFMIVMFRARSSRRTANEPAQEDVRWAFLHFSAARLDHRRRSRRAVHIPACCVGA